MGDVCDTEDSMLRRFPSEIFEKFFYNLDGQSLARCRQVCKTWYDIICNMSRITDVWKKFCLREISAEVLRQLNGPAEIFRIGTTRIPPIVDWFLTYRLWFQGQYVLHKTPVKTEINREHLKPIMCLKLSGSVAITGHRDGTVQLWDVCTGERINTVTRHFKMVTCLALVDILHSGSYDLGDGHESKHHHMISVSKDRVIQLCPLDCNNSEEFKTYLCSHSDVLDSVKVFGNRFVVNCLDNTLSLWQIQTPRSSSSTMEAVLLLFLPGPLETLCWISFWQEKIFCLCQMGISNVYDIEIQEWEQGKKIKFIWPENKNSLIKRNASKQCIFMNRAFFFLNNIVFLTTINSLLCISTNGRDFNVHHPILSLQSAVCSVSFWGSILALGMENGDVFLYHVPHPDRLMDLDLKRYNWTDHLSEASITSIEVFDSGSGPVVAAATNQEVFFIRWWNHMN